MRRAFLASAGGALAAALVAPTPVLAHGLVGRSDLPVPDWLFTWGAVAVLVVSFVALAAAWPRPKLQEPRTRALPAGLSRVLLSRPAEIVCGLVGVALFALVIYTGFAGTQTVTANWAPTFVFVAFWLGLVPVSLVFGDVFRALNPWRAIGRAVGWIVARVTSETPEPLAYPQRLGYWPAAVGLLAFGWLELISANGDDPGNVAIASLIYAACMFVGMALFGVEQWTDRGDGFAVYYNLFARMSPLGRRDGRLVLRPPLGGLPAWQAGPGSVALLAVMIGVVSFDGLSGGKPFNDLIGNVIPWLRDDLGLGPPQALEVSYAGSMLLAIGLCAGFYLLGMRGAHGVDRGVGTRELSLSFVHTLVPIALAYVAAHYVSLLLLQGQALAFLASDPLGRGADLLGTADATIDYGFIGAEAFWYLQVGFVILGHVGALVLAHDRALAVYRDARTAVRSQYWLLAVMVGFTTLALWLLAQAREG